MDEPTPDFKKILRVLVDHGVEFVVIGGVGAVLQGAPIATFDLDIVYSRSDENLDRLLVALDKLDAVYRAAQQRHLRPARSHLSSAGHQLLMTRCGPLDLLGAAGNGRDYADLLKEADSFDAWDLCFHVLGLKALISLKEETGHAKDRAVLEILRAVAAERESDS